MSSPLEFGLKNQFQFNMIKDALSWWVNNFPIIYKKRAHAYKWDIKKLEPFAKKLLNSMDKPSKFPYKFSITSMKSEQAFVVALDDYLVHNKNIRKPKNRDTYKATYNVAMYAFKDYTVRKIMNE